MLMQLAVAALALAEQLDSTSAASPQPRIEIDSAQREIVVTVGPLAIPARTAYSHHTPEFRLQFAWPVEGWVRGYRIELIDSSGNVLPRELLHHAGVANLDRRQLAYQKVERLFAIGRETAPVLLPASMGVPLGGGQRLALYFAMVNPKDSVIYGVSLRLSLAWTPRGAVRPRDVFVLFLDAKPGAGVSSAFDVPPGRSTTTAEFTLPISGRVRTLGGHLHDYAVEMRVEDVESGRILARLRARNDAEGRIRGVSRSRFLLTRGGLRLHANRTYRVVAVYDNPTGVTIPSGGMALLAGPFAPDDARLWPAIDATNPDYRRDLASIVGVDAHRGHDDHATYRFAP